MPRLSIFTPCGQLRCSSEPSLVEQYYRLLPILWGPGIDFTQIGSDDEAKLYAVARMLALGHAELEHARNQAIPLKVNDLLPLLENDYLIVPGPKDTVPQRQQAVATAMLLTRGAIASNVVAILRALAGSGFLAYIPSPAGQGNQTINPASPGAGPGAFKDVRQAAKLVQLVDPIVATGSPCWAAYQALDTSAVPTAVWTASLQYAEGQQIVPSVAGSVGAYFACQTAGTTGTTEPAWTATPGATVTDGSVVWVCVGPIAPALVAGDVVVVEPGKTSRMEKVTITGVANTPPAGSNTTPGYLYLQATFAKAHDPGVPLTTGQAPYWWSTQRLNYAVLTSSSASDKPTRAKIDNLFAKLLRVVDRWAIVAPTSTTSTGGTLGPLSAGMGMGTSPIGTIPFTNSN